jgi:peptidyl-prolyl cis-trans isomerase B (cyclophilin B)
MHRRSIFWASLVAALSCVLALVYLTGLKSGPLSTAANAAAETTKSKIPGRTKQMRMITTEGEIVLELFEDEAPETVANFKKYAVSGHYDGTVFHRVIKGFMIQGGGFEPGMTQKETGEPIKNEADNGIKNEVGTIAMARTNDPHSATAQFFINVANNEFLNHRSPDPQGWGYAVFGKVISGMDVVKSIENVPTGQQGPHGDVPNSDVIIKKVEEIE